MQMCNLFVQIILKMRFLLLFATGFVFTPFWSSAQIAVYETATYFQMVEVEGAVELDLPVGEPASNAFVDGQIEVSFQANAFGEMESGEATWFDFVQKKTFKTDREGYLMSVTELHHVVDYRLAESANRQFLNGMLQSASLETSFFSSQLNEEILFRHSFNDSVAKKTLTLEEKGDTLIWYSGNQVVTKYIPGKKGKRGITVDSELLNKYLLYQHEVHPYISKTISESGKCPEFLEYTFASIGQIVTKTFRLKSNQKERAKTLPVLNELACKPTTIGGKWHQKLNQLHAQLLANEVQVVDSTEMVAAYKRLKGEGENLSALLVLFDYLLSTGIQPAAQIAEVASLAGEDQELGLFLGALASPNSKEAAEKNIATLNELIGKGGEYAYVMYIFSANHIQPSDKNRALNYFELALLDNPTIAGVYLDLGNIFCSRYDFELGWKCYYAAEILAPDHSMGVDVDRKRKNLEEALPAYF